MKILYLHDKYAQQRQHQKPRKIYPVLMAMEAEWYRQKGHHVCWTDKDSIDYPIDYSYYDKVITEPEGLPFLDLPPPDRKFTRWWEYQDNGNFKYHPATYILAANGCWHGQCTFCVERGVKYEVRPVDAVIDEIRQCEAMGFREVFDDSGTFPMGRWLDEFLSKFKSRIRISCNARFNSNLDFVALRNSGFRMLLFGLESANRQTLARISKGIDIDKVVTELRRANKAGIEAHVACMFGFPWESGEDAYRTLKLVWYLLRKGYAKTAQASLYDPPDGTRNDAHAKYVPMIYNAAYNLEFWFNKLRDVKDKDDLRYLWRQIKAGLRRE